MGGYNGPKARINRRLGVNVYDSNGAIRAARKRPTRPGEHPWVRRKPSEYGLALSNKQVLKHYYGLRERQLRRFFDIAQKMRGDVGASLLEVCERRLDNIVWRAGFAKTRSQGRQGVAHGHFTVNGRVAHTPSQLVKVGDVIAVRDRKNLKALYEQVLQSNDRDKNEFVQVDKQAQSFVVNRLPVATELTLDVDINKVVEMMGR